MLIGLCERTSWKLLFRGGVSGLHARRSINSGQRPLAVVPLKPNVYVNFYIFFSMAQSALQVRHVVAESTLLTYISHSEKRLPDEQSQKRLPDEQSQKRFLDEQSEKRLPD